MWNKNILICMLLNLIALPISDCFAENSISQSMSMKEVLAQFINYAKQTQFD